MAASGNPAAVVGSQVRRKRCFRSRRVCSRACTRPHSAGGGGTSSIRSIRPPRSRSAAHRHGGKPCDSLLSSWGEATGTARTAWRRDRSGKHLLGQQPAPGGGKGDSAPPRPYVPASKDRDEESRAMPARRPRAVDRGCPGEVCAALSRYQWIGRRSGDFPRCGESAALVNESDPVTRGTPNAPREPVRRRNAGERRRQLPRPVGPACRAGPVRLGKPDLHQIGAPRAGVLA